MPAITMISAFPDKGGWQGEQIQQWIQIRLLAQLFDLEGFKAGRLLRGGRSGG